MKRKVNHFTDDYRLKVVKEYLSTCQSADEISEKYGISSTSLYRWIIKFDIPKPDNDLMKKLELMSKEVKKSKSELSLEAKVKKLEEELKYEKLRTEALSTMINIAENRFNIPIRKKSGTKQ